MNRDAPFYEKVEKDVPYWHPKRFGPQPKRVPFDTLKVPIGTPKETLIVNQSQNYLINFNFLTNQN